MFQHFQRLYIKYEPNTKNNFYNLTRHIHYNDMLYSHVIQRYNMAGFKMWQNNAWLTDQSTPSKGNVKHTYYYK